MLNLAVATSFPALEPDARLLAGKLNLPMAEGKQYDYLLVLTPDYLGLQKCGSKALPVFVDFLSIEMNRRRKQASLKREALARALGLKGQSSAKIVDATAGLGRDSFILACLGFEVILLERSPIVFALLKDGLNRASQNEQLAPIIARMHLIQTDALSWLKTTQPDLVYLDPMFPEKRKSALVKKNMQFFQEIIGNDVDAETLLQTALTCANNRVVVKRPRLAAPLAGQEPAFCLEGSSSRFDVYLISRTP